MPSRFRRRRSPGRWLAPLALLVAGVAVYLVLGGGGGDSGGGATATTSSTSTSSKASKASKAKAKRKAKHRTYTVKSGDTLSGIAAKTKVSLERLQVLNPKLDSQSLQTGETIKLGP